MGLRLMLNWLKTWWAPGENAPEMPTMEPQHPLDVVCATYGASYLREITTDHQEVQITLIRPNATLSATGATTADAVAKVVAKAEKCWGAL